MSSETRTLSAHSDSDVPWYRTLVTSLLDYGERTKDALVFSSAYLVVIAMVEVATVMIALSLPPSPAPIVVGLVTFAIYAGDRLADVETDELSTPRQSAFVRRHETALSVLTAAAYGVAIATAVTGGPLALAVTLLPGAFWILYASDWLPTLGAYFKRLKDVLVVNSAVVALAWAIALVFLPLAFADAAFTPTAAVVFTYFFLDTFVNTEIPNLDDMEADAAIGVSTMPVVFGVRRTRRALYGLDLFLIVFLALAYLGGLLSVAVAVAVLVGLGYALVVAAFVGRTDRYRRLSIAGEAKHLIVFAVVVGLLGNGL
ncbi:MAG: UbiA family prenyltransferase [Haloferacaceae archaeon]